LQIKKVKYPPENSMRIYNIILERIIVWSSNRFGVFSKPPDLSNNLKNNSTSLKSYHYYIRKWDSLSILYRDSTRNIFISDSIFPLSNKYGKEINAYLNNKELISLNRFDHLDIKLLKAKGFTNIEPLRNEFKFRNQYLSIGTLLFSDIAFNKDSTRACVFASQNYGEKGGEYLFYLKRTIKGWKIDKYQLVAVV
jgi:hypothetical protein